MGGGGSVVYVVLFCYVMICVVLWKGGGAGGAGIEGTGKIELGVWFNLEGEAWKWETRSN